MALTWDEVRVLEGEPGRGCLHQRLLESLWSHACRLLDCLEVLDGRRRLRLLLGGLFEGRQAIHLARDDLLSADFQALEPVILRKSSYSLLFPPFLHQGLVDVVRGSADAERVALPGRVQVIV